ncbi:ABC transporter permease [Janthinobacterium sp. 17J80-10]|uniref:MlaE family ABC transporter permease n=1 Tax=Janthinobacterium sp. 17J80-10 TaxID=2497863 RepID=UPI0010055DBE|nr:ABC transporter permease [Janthinobacterium sp. 17J80-10]QAU33236.1 ABC transporter permease [Janthinobacterium sp. 17J80-10]
MPPFENPVLTPDPSDASRLCARGAWQVHALAQAGVLPALQTSLSKAHAAPQACAWDLSGLTALDHIGAQWLWNAWGNKVPPGLAISPRHQAYFDRLQEAGTLALPVPANKSLLPLAELLKAWRGLFDHVLGFLALLGQLVLDIGTLLRRPRRAPWKEISANVYHAGYQALGITALVGFLIGVVLSYLSAQQLRTFGGDIYLVNILGMSVVRELGPLLAAILVAGRSGSAITAQLGVMRVTEELDAMLVMGLPHGFRLILPKVMALSVAMPLLVIWTDAMALTGGMVAAELELNLSPAYFVQRLPDAVPLANYWIGLGKGWVFGILIALVACHFGLRIKPNTESLGQGTTISVVTAITIVIVADAVFAIVFSDVGLI